MSPSPNMPPSPNMSPSQTMSPSSTMLHNARHTRQISWHQGTRNVNYAGVSSWTTRSYDLKGIYCVDPSVATEMPLRRFSLKLREVALVTSKRRIAFQMAYACAYITRGAMRHLELLSTLFIVTWKSTTCGYYIQFGAPHL
jgi:hypothetical protein